jgi:cupin 2 domain-containing protein
MNLFEGEIPIKGEHFTTLLEHKNVKIIRIVSSSDLEPYQYCQDEDEWVVLIEGKAQLMLNNQKYTLQKGQSLWIPAKTKHTIQWTQEGTIWLAVHIF